MNKRILFTLMLCVVSFGTFAGDAVDESRPMSPDGRLLFNAVTGDFQIKGSDQDQLVITGTLGTDVRELVIEGEDGSWEVKLKPTERRGRMPRVTTSSKLTILVPRGAEVEATTISGNLKAADLAGRRVNLMTVSGSVRMDGVAPYQLEVQTVSGEQRMDAGGTTLSRLRSVSGNIEAGNLAGRISVNSVSGNIKLNGINVEELEVETVSGRVRADLTPATRGRYRMSSHSGSIVLTLPAETPLALRANSFSGRISSGFGGEVRRGRGPGEQLDHRIGDGSVQVESKTFSGSIEIRQQN